MITAVSRAGGKVAGASVFELGTGYRPNVPLAFWLHGALRVTSVDLNRYLSPSLFDKDLLAARSAPEEALADLESPLVPTDNVRLAFLLHNRTHAVDMLREMSFEYIAPCDAARVGLPGGTFDLHISRSVLEHIEPTSMEAIFNEARRLLRPGGLLVHLVDFSDHSAHSDSTITSVNFLQFSSTQWDCIAGNRFAYHNRLRVDDYLGLFARLDLKVLLNDSWVDQRALDVLRGEFPLDECFRGRQLTDLATYSSLFILSP